MDAAGDTLEVLDPRTNLTYVLVRADVYERLQSILEDGFSSEDAFRAQLESAAQAGLNDPEMDIYNELDPRRQP